MLPRQYHWCPDGRTACWKSRPPVLLTSPGSSRCPEVPQRVPRSASTVSDDFPSWFGRPWRRINEMLNKMRCLLATSVSNVGREEAKCKHSLIKSLLALLSDITCTLLGPSHAFPLHPKHPSAHWPQRSVGTQRVFLTSSSWDPHIRSHLTHSSPLAGQLEQLS